MTRLAFGLPFVLSLVAAAPLTAQVGQQPGRVYGPSAGPQQPVRQVGADQPIRQPAGTPPAQAVPLAPAAPQPPGWIPLDVEHEKWVNQILQYWENRSNKIKALSCQFTRWDYDPVFGPKDPNVAKTIASGEIKYAQPDKGLFKVTRLSLYTGKGEPPYAAQDPNFAEHWVCDGRKVIQFDAVQKQVREQELPPELQGKAIADGPLPFLFGARAETIRARYWVRGLPQSGNGKYWLEAVPKSIHDARNFKAVTIVLDEKSFLPELMEVLDPNYDSEKNPSRETYQFTSHDVTDSALSATEILKKLNIFKAAFYAPATPAGWTRVVLRADGTTRSPGISGALEATKPAPPRNLAPLPR
jgi:TIGR03009 family protein